MAALRKDLVDDAGVLIVVILNRINLAHLVIIGNAQNVVLR